MCVCTHGMVCFLILFLFLLLSVLLVKIKYTKEVKKLYSECPYTDIQFQQLLTTTVKTKQPTRY